MCTRAELNSLVRELLRHIEQVALLSAKIQFDEELKSNKPAEYLTCSDHTKNYVRNNAQNARFKQVTRFHMAYLKYFVFAADPYAEFIMPLSSSSLALFITNIMTKMATSTQQIPLRHTSKTIIEFLQIINANLVHSFYLQYRRDLQNVMKEMHLPYDIEILTKIRHEAFRKNIDMQRRGVPMRVPIIQRTIRNSSQKTRVVHVTKPSATAPNLSQPPAQVHALHQLQPMRMASIEQHMYAGSSAQYTHQQHLLQMQSATTTTETLCADMQIPTVTSSMQPNPVPSSDVYQVYTTNGQPIDPSMPVYLITSNEPITVEVTSSNDSSNFEAIDTDQTCLPSLSLFDFE